MTCPNGRTAAGHRPPGERPEAQDRAGAAEQPIRARGRLRRGRRLGGPRRQRPHVAIQTHTRQARRTHSRTDRGDRRSLGWRSTQPWERVDVRAPALSHGDPEARPGGARDGGTRRPSRPDRRRRTDAAERDAVSRAGTPQRERRHAASDAAAEHHGARAGGTQRRPGIRGQEQHAPTASGVARRGPERRDHHERRDRRDERRRFGGRHRRSVPRAAARLDRIGGLDAESVQDCRKPRAALRSSARSGG